ncbi:MAG: HAD hydrolase-like protein [Candidatus Latescibacterota bacterium]|nr:HAD hydrolase-like protein [Candidatus Latescibacterota bacterium]
MSETPAPLRVAIFDFDYTLADSSEGVIDCVQTAQETMGLEISDAEPIRRTIGLSVQDTIVRLNGESLRERAEEFATLFRQHADEVMVDHTRLYEGVPALFAALAQRGLSCAIATTKYRYRIEQILRRDGLEEAVHCIVGAEDVTEHKPDPACLLHVLASLRNEAQEAIYVGDSAPDAGAAQRAGIDFVLVETGLAALSSLDSYPRVAQLKAATDLPDWLAHRETT